VEARLAAETVDGEGRQGNSCAHKKCTKCGLVKGLDEFNQNRKVKSDGRVSVCRPCCKIVAAAYRARPEVKEKSAAYLAERYRTDPEYRESLKRNAQKPERIAQKKAYAAEYRRKNAVRIKEYNAEYVQRDDAREKRRSANHQHHQRRKAAGYPHRKNDKVRATLRKWYQQRRKNPKWNLHHRIASHIRAALREGKAGRRWEDLVGYTVEELQRHLERQFLPGMSWDNMSKWHVDHIVPVSSFSFSSFDDDDFRACWSLTNLRPLWARDNVSKGDKRTHLI
jgi:hypothetical protein